MGSKRKPVAYSITLLRANLKNHKYRRQQSVDSYKACIKNKVGERTRMRFLRDMQFRDQLIDDLNNALKKLLK